MKNILQEGKNFLGRMWLYIRMLAKWLVIAGIIGVLCGVIGSIFHIGVHEGTLFRQTHPWMLFLLPIAGLVIVGFYKLTKTEGAGTNDIIAAVSQGKEISLWLLPAIFIGTILTHLCGGSAGREGAALQMGGTIGHHVGKLFKLDERDERSVTMIGMVAFFSALFGTPIAAAVFAMMVVTVGVVYHSMLVPCIFSSLTAFGISLLMGVEPTRFIVTIPDWEVGMFIRVAILAALCALVSILFCEVIHFAEHQMADKLKNSWIRVIVGGVAIIALTYLCGTTDYNGAGMDVVTRAIEEGNAHPLAFLLKLLFTAITLSAGFKGGEVVPSFFVGATFGCVAGPLLGIPAGFAAAIGLVSVFCGAVNCPLASTFLAIELFGGNGLIYYAIACSLSNMLSGYQGLYSSQRILYSKLKAQYINVRTNSHHAQESLANEPLHKD